ncbi:OsmC family protein [uncultured Paracoccus sp.]|uniref:OsmC family protein n=1 Tax=uncultured Paracoccus sp. TaxID=189685 RepID=UPI00260F48F3|nr:OsmC family protein [uncultured Paracoccus sp.]
MALKFKPKTYGPVHVHFDGEGGVSFAEGETGERHAHPPHSTPVVTLLASLGHCLLESLRIVARGKGLTPGAFTITVIGERALDLPGRLGSIRYAVEGWPMDQPGGGDLVADAKAICTISNSLGPVTISAGLAAM